MSTRGCIARIKDTGFEGVYHHWDSYPSGLGNTLWNLYHEHFNHDINAMLEYLIDNHPAGWSTINNKVFNIAPGYAESGKLPCSICGKPMWKHYYQYYEQHGCLTPDAILSMRNGNYVALGHAYQEPDIPKGPECYCHGDRHEDRQVIDVRNAAACGCEYAYVFNDRNQMAIMSSYHPGPENAKMIGMFGMGDPDARWQPLAIVELDGIEPDWEKIDIS